MRLGSRRFWLILAVLSAPACRSYNPEPRVGGTFDPCCQGAGICVPGGALPSNLAPQLAADSCGTDLLCAPALLVNDPRASMPACRAAGNLEGRCLPSCVPEVARQADALKQENCAPGALCVPCFNPLTGMDSGACHLGGDPGPAEPARVFGKCCQDQGRCMPAALVPPENQDDLGPETCTETGALCVPESWLPPSVPAPKACEANGNFEGRCMPLCVPLVARQAEQLDKASCTDSERCVPCFDPRTGDETGACKLGTDAPRQPARVFGRCCGGRARCVPRELVPPEGVEQLRQLECQSERDLCVPEAWLDDPIPTPATCRAPGGLEGRCTPSCALGDQASQLQRTTCAAGDLCAPCFNPLTGESTGSCGLGQDPGPREPPKEFGSCCESRARCVPREFVQAEGSEQLRPLDCQGSDEVCVPEPWLMEAMPAPAVSCRARGDLEGRCLLGCLLGEDAASLEQGSCAQAEVCAPCFDPRTGKETGSCMIGSDPGPTEPAKQFAQCCGGRARCVPSELVPAEGAGQLRPLDCTGEREVCVPEAWLEESSSAAISCRAPGNLEGRCIPDCLAADTPGLTQASCSAGNVCAPCFDPRTGMDTEVCRQQGDAPVEPARGFADCCGTEGKCVPVELLTADQRSALPVDSCTAYPARCVPATIAAGQPPGPACGDDGVCMDRCFIDALAGLILSSEGCASDERCVPCSEVGCE